MKNIKITSLMLICLLTLSSAPIIFANSASAVTGAVNFLPNNFQSGTDTNHEIDLSTDTSYYITCMLIARYRYNIRELTDATVYDYDNFLAWAQTYSDEIIVFSKGHRGVPYLSANPPNSNHYSLLDHYGNNVVDTTNIYQKTSSKNVFTFIWHCETALKYPGNGIPPYDTWGYYSMPYCWTHNANMQQYGTSGSQVYLGWNNNVPGNNYPQPRGGSPQYEYEYESSAHYWYAHVSYLFWDYLCQGYTTRQALDRVAVQIHGSGSTFTSTQLMNWLIVYGNQNLGLP
ncbi:MAG: hypothetical protein FWB84_06535 [Candidatus Bathyarchaeota archaeon]|uniref:hypothetical protein n=1 Tax=Candidatus Bathycorpusculum sp. TaxID=2994959 RepID=UPI002822376E|nr:hypothetical protein [Candidatus Termiticorpusculum sp.]MCL2291811.1 hypothetical protein [Candidatus Termiticorpusculum sp.]